MTPYYQQDGITIYHGDCREVLPSLSADLCITDPPYNLGIEYGHGVDDDRPDYEQWCRMWFAQIHAPAIALTPGVANVAMWCGVRRPEWIIAWHKPAAMGRCPVGFNNWEPVLFYGEAKPNRGADVITAVIRPDASVEGHPCPKPERWALGLVTLLSDPDETILDPFVGSGTTLVAAKRLGRKAIGIEIEEAYCEIAARRLMQGALPLEWMQDEPAERLETWV